MKTLVTVEMAQEILKNNVSNRRLKSSIVEFLSQEIISGRFLYNGEAILISKTNRLLDGQHRLQAIIKCGISTYLNIERNIDDDVMHTIDTGSARTAGDVFDINGIPNANWMAATIRLIMNEFDTKSKQARGVGGAIKISSGEILDFYRVNEQSLILMAEFVNDLYSSGVKIFTKTNTLAYLYLFSTINNNSEQIAKAFMRELFTGRQEGISNVAILLHRKLVNNNMSLHKMVRRDIINNVIYSFIKYKEGTVLKILKANTTVTLLTFKNVCEKA